MSPSRYSQSLQSGLKILASFNGEQRSMGVIDFADMLSASSKSTAHRYASTLATLGYLEQRADRRYELSEKAADVGLSWLGALPMLAGMSEPLRRLRDQSGYTASIAMLLDEEVIYLGQYRGHRKGQFAVDDRTGPGLRLPADRTAAGELLIRHRPPRRPRVENDVVVCAHKTGPKMWSLASPLRDAAGTVRAAVELSLPELSLSRDELIALLGPFLTACSANWVLGGAATGYAEANS
jgi:DNA-binding IclR family transcriptional regulator